MSYGRQSYFNQFINHHYNFRNTMKNTQSKYSNFKIQIKNNHPEEATEAESDIHPIPQIHQFHGPRKFYETVTNRAVSLSDTTFTLEKIPNCLKVIEDRRRIILCHLPNPALYSLKKIIGHQLDSTIYIHVGRGAGELLLQTKDQEDYHVNMISKTSYQIMQHQMRNTIVVINCKGQLSMSIEVLEPLPDEIFRHNIIVEKFPRKIPEAARYCKIAMLRDEKMTIDDVRRRLLFIDVECAHGLENQPLPISVAAMDFDGKILINQLICPRAYVDRYNDSIHGLVEKDLIGQEDSLEVLRRMTKMMKGRIIVGFDLHMEHIALKIDLDQIAGVRDLQSCKAIANVMNDERKSWSLSDVAKTLGLQPQARFHTAIEDVRLIRKIYIALEKNWTDTARQDIGALYVRKNKEEVEPTRSRLEYTNQIRMEKAVEKIAKRAGSSYEEERLIVDDNKRRKEDCEQQSSSKANEITMSPHISINDGEEQWITPPSSPNQVPMEQVPIQTVEKVILPQTEEINIPSAGEITKVQISTKDMTWTITGSNLKMTCTSRRPKKNTQPPDKK